MKIIIRSLNMVTKNLNNHKNVKLVKTDISVWLSIDHLFLLGRWFVQSQTEISVQTNFKFLVVPIIYCYVQASGYPCHLLQRIIWLVIRQNVCVSGGKKCSFCGKFDVICFLETSVLRFALLPYYRWYLLLFRGTNLGVQSANINNLLVIY